MKDFFEELEKWENSFYCNECGADKNTDFIYDRTVANGEFWHCRHCKTETIVEDKPNEDTFYVNDIRTEYKAEKTKIDISDIIKNFNKLTNEQICETYDILNDGFKAHTHYILKVEEMRGIIRGTIQPCCTFERWLLLIEYLKSVGCDCI